MSLWPDKTIALHIEAHDVRAAYLGPWPRRAVLGRSRQSVDVLDADPSGALASAIDSAITDCGIPSQSRATRLRVVLGDTRLHFDVVSGDYRGASVRDLNLVAQACVEELLGEDSRDWEVRWHLQSDMQHLFICAASRQDMGLLADAAKRNGLSLGSVESDFCRQWNLHARERFDDTGLFASQSESHIVAACVSRGSIVALTQGSVRGESPDVDDAAEAPDYGALDTRVNRLLASLGIEADRANPFILVTPDHHLGAAASRWSVLEPLAHAR